MKVPAFHKGREFAFTWTELVVVVAVIAVLLFLAFPPRPRAWAKAQTIQTLSNMKQLHLATLTMARDGEIEKNPARGWPGDIGGTFTDWARQLVPSYLATNEFCKLVSAPGATVPPTAIPAKDRIGLLVYAVDKSSPDAAVFLTSANFTNTPHGGTPLNPKAKPYGDKGFVVFRKGGDGAVLLRNQTTNAMLIGEYAPLCK